MDHFHYKEGQLFAEEVALKDVADAYGTPTFVYSRATLERHANAYINSFKNKADMLVIDPDSEFFKYFKDIK